ncbi:MAG: hypothetical protein Q4A11_07215 [Brachymonas sp.]|nr:hypothetical protein [Brachymonas sp.]
MQFEELKPEQLEACKELKPSPEAPSYFDLLRALGNLLDGFSPESIHFRGEPRMQSLDVDHLRAVKIATMNTAAQTFPKHPLCRAYFDGQAVQGKYKGKKFSGTLDLSNSKALPDRENMLFCVKLDASNSKSKADTKKSEIYIDTSDDTHHIEPVGADYSTFS